MNLIQIDILKAIFQNKSELTMHQSMRLVEEKLSIL